ncbi:MAG TPA: cyclodeaminase/cyclohydrolase family protein [Thermoanaerobaculia bacterium]|nr:cyclodeaminase/cyclohydrolase family protein [Thermoanaerobaculia bacterium]
MNFEKLSFEDLVKALASDAPTPGGGTAAALAGAMGASLAEMVAALTLAKEKYSASHEAVRPIGLAAAHTRGELLRLAQEDSDSYDAVVAARRMPKETEEERAARIRRMSDANRAAAEVPMRTAREAAGLLASLPELAEKGNPNAASDAGAAALLLEAAVQGALLNVGINLSGADDAHFAARMTEESEHIGREAARLREKVLSAVRARL